MFETPVVLVVYNRPAETARVFAALRELRPNTLFVVADGPGSWWPDDASRCEAVRNIVAGVDWPCDVRRNYSGTNLGCGRRVSSGLDWVFSQVEEAVILEDDCLPHPHFFTYCRELLARYRDDRRVFCISGFSPPTARLASHPHSYYFSRHFGMWGWATWRRSWSRYDFAMREWTRLRETDWLEHLLGRGGAARQYARDFENVYRNNGRRGIVDTWDFQFVLAMMREDALCIKPARNLIRNIGIGSAYATHTRLDNALSRLGCAGLPDPLVHPPEVCLTSRLDRAVFDRYYRRSEIAYTIKQQIKKFPALAKRMMRLYVFLHTYTHPRRAEL